jgi:hypothetical protein
MNLDPAFCWAGGYWEQKLRDVAVNIAKEKYDGWYWKALRELSRRVVILQLVPYHSRSLGDRDLLSELESTRQAQQFARTELVSRAADGRAVVVVVRGVSKWRLPRCANVIRYRKGEVRSASLSPQSRGGKAILRRILG